MTKMKLFKTLIAVSVLGSMVLPEKAQAIMCNNGQTVYVCVSELRKLRQEMRVSEIYWAFGGCKPCTVPQQQQWPEECAYPFLPSLAECKEIMNDKHARLYHNGQAGPFAQLSHGVFKKTEDAIDKIGDALIDKGVEKINELGVEKNNELAVEKVMKLGR